MHRPTRRSFLQVGGVAAAGALGALVPAEAAHTPDDSFLRLRRRWREVTAGSGKYDPAVEPYRTWLAELGRRAARQRDTMAPARTSLWPDQAFPSFVATPRRLRDMAHAYVLEGTGLAGDPGLAAAVVAGVDHYRRHVYAAGAEPAGNWWHWRERRTGGGVTRDYVTLWLDHGVDPRSAGYVYLLLPGASQEETRRRAADPGWVRVLANTARVQAVHVPSLGIVAANFWTAGTVGGLTASAPCAVLVREDTLTVSDPRCELDELTVTWATAGARLTGSAFTFRGLADQEGASKTIRLR
ncbi:polysaccharide lyase beta-sandwich domain-containing protein [Nonomuraea sp. NPDC049400]|uniref:polysaccharide lyase beta-sandwich domain-containing protein n=1 Tax=Nonomuraea sp. NPDC049400 TaxID=3364352 RepID=UPI0037923F26